MCCPQPHSSVVDVPFKLSCHDMPVAFNWVCGVAATLNWFAAMTQSTLVLVVVYSDMIYDNTLYLSSREEGRGKKTIIHRKPKAWLRCNVEPGSFLWVCGWTRKRMREEARSAHDL